MLGCAAGVGERSNGGVVGGVVGSDGGARGEATSARQGEEEEGEASQAGQASAAIGNSKWRIISCAVDSATADHTEVVV